MPTIIGTPATTQNVSPSDLLSLMLRQNSGSSPYRILRSKNDPHHIEVTARQSPNPAFFKTQTYSPVYFILVARLNKRKHLRMPQ